MAIIYVREGCPKCDELLAASRRRYENLSVVDVGRNPERVPELVKLTGGKRIVPVLVDGATFRIAPDGGSEF